MFARRLLRAVDDVSLEMPGDAAWLAKRQLPAKLRQ
jgi:hypothetical protein